MTDRVIRVAIAGQGRSGFDIHARWLREAGRQYKIVAVADELPQRRDQAAKELGCRTCKNWQELLKDGDYDLFVNALPSTLHPPVTLKALQAGLDVVCEKPAATKVSDFDKVVAAARKARRHYLPFQNSRFYPFFQKMREVIASGVLGEILHITSNWSGYARRWDWQTLQKHRGGNLNNTGPHPMDQAIVLFGQKMPSIFSRMISGPNSYGDADDLTLVTLYGKGSPTIEVIVSSYQAYPRGEMYNVSGTRGGLTGGPRGLKWKYFDPRKATRRSLMKGWSDNRQYCGEALPWTEKSWEPKQDMDDFQFICKSFYDNLYDVLTKKAKPIIRLDQVRRQIASIEECHRQNPLPKYNQKWNWKKK